MALACLGFSAFRAARAEPDTVVYSFTGAGDGGEPVAGLVADEAGIFYGTTTKGGNGGCGCGTVFKVTSSGAMTTLYSFMGGSDGANPTSALLVDRAENLYGTTASGGNDDCGFQACGTVFKIAADGTETVLYAFKGGNDDGFDPLGGVISDAEGNFYGTTYLGGETKCGHGCGTIFKLAPDGTETVLHAFRGGKDGSNPVAGLLTDDVGNSYGTTVYGGKRRCIQAGCGTVFALSTSGKEAILHAFNYTNGTSPQTGLISDRAGNLFGVTGGMSAVLYRLANNGRYSILFRFHQGTVGTNPSGNLLADVRGDLFVNNLYGGNSGCGYYGCGTLFELPSGKYGKALHRFNPDKGDGQPSGNLAADALGRIWGVTEFGGAYGHGAIFRIKR